MPAPRATSRSPPPREQVLGDRRPRHAAPQTPPSRPAAHRRASSRAAAMARHRRAVGFVSFGVQRGCAAAVTIAATVRPIVQNSHRRAVNSPQMPIAASFARSRRRSERSSTPLSATAHRHRSGGRVHGSRTARAFGDGASSPPAAPPPEVAAQPILKSARVRKKIRAIFDAMDVNRRRGLARRGRGLRRALRPVALEAERRAVDVRSVDRDGDAASTRRVGGVVRLDVLHAASARRGAAVDHGRSTRSLSRPSSTASGDFSAAAADQVEGADAPRVRRARGRAAGARAALLYLTGSGAAAWAAALAAHEAAMPLPGGAQGLIAFTAVVNAVGAFLSLVALAVPHAPPAERPRLLRSLGYASAVAMVLFSPPPPRRPSPSARRRRARAACGSCGEEPGGGGGAAAAWQEACAASAPACECGYELLGRRPGGRRARRARRRLGGGDARIRHERHGGGRSVTDDPNRPRRRCGGGACRSRASTRGPSRPPHHPRQRHRLGLALTLMASTRIAIARPLLGAIRAVGRRVSTRVPARPEPVARPLPSPWAGRLWWEHALQLLAHVCRPHRGHRRLLHHGVADRATSTRGPTRSSRRTASARSSRRCSIAGSLRPPPRTARCCRGTEVAHVGCKYVMCRDYSVSSLRCPRRPAARHQRPPPCRRPSRRYRPSAASGTALMPSMSIPLCGLLSLAYGLSFHAFPAELAARSSDRFCRRQPRRVWLRRCPRLPTASPPQDRPAARLLGFSSYCLRIRWIGLRLSSSASLVSSMRRTAQRR